MNKLEFGKQVARDINNCQGVTLNLANVFGGFVRDMLAGDEPRDLDVLCQSKHNALDIIHALLHQGYTISQTAKTRKRNPGYGFMFTVMLISVSKGEDQIDLDIVKQNLGGEFNLDVDVNRLVWDPRTDTIGMNSFHSPGDFNPISMSILTRAKDKKFQREYGASITRILNMENKGWTEISR